MAVPFNGPPELDISVATVAILLPPLAICVARLSPQYDDPDLSWTGPLDYLWLHLLRTKCTNESVQAAMDLFYNLMVRREYRTGYSRFWSEDDRAASEICLLPSDELLIHRFFATLPFPPLIPEDYDLIWRIAITFAHVTWDSGIGEPQEMVVNALISGLSNKEQGFPGISISLRAAWSYRSRLQYISDGDLYLKEVLIRSLFIAAKDIVLADATEQSWDTVSYRQELMSKCLRMIRMTVQTSGWIPSFISTVRISECVQKLTTILYFQLDKTKPTFSLMLDFFDTVALLNSGMKELHTDHGPSPWEKSASTLHRTWGFVYEMIKDAFPTEEERISYTEAPFVCLHETLLDLFRLLVELTISSLKESTSEKKDTELLAVINAIRDHLETFQATGGVHTKKKGRRPSVPMAVLDAAIKQLYDLTSLANMPITS